MSQTKRVRVEEPHERSTRSKDMTNALYWEHRGSGDYSVEEKLYVIRHYEKTKEPFAKVDKRFKLPAQSALRWFRLHR